MTLGAPHATGWCCSRSPSSARWCGTTSICATRAAQVIALPMAALVRFAVLAVLVAPPHLRALRRPRSAARSARCRAIIETRCLACHSVKPTHPTAPVRSCGVMLDTPQRDRIMVAAHPRARRRHAQDAAGEPDGDDGRGARDRQPLVFGRGTYGLKARRETKVKARAIATGVLGILLGTASSAAEEVRFTGNTTATRQLIGDALHQLVTIADSKLTCTKLEAVVAEVMPRDFRPPGASKVASGGAVTYERWTATLCGQQVAFLVTFWAPPQGGTKFAIGYPFPSAR